MNTPAAPQSPTAPRRTRRWPRRLALGTAITLVVLFAGHLTWYLLASAELDRARVAASAAGLSQDVASVIPPPCAEADNAALRYQRAMGLLTLGGKPYVPGQSEGELDQRLLALLQQHWHLPSDREEREAALVAKAAAILQVLDHEDFARAWRLVAEGARLPRCSFALSYERGVVMPLPHCGLIRSICSLGSLRARLLATAGRQQEAADQFADLLWMLRQARREALTTYESWMSLHAEGLVLEHLRRALQAGQLAGADAGRCQIALAGEQRTQTWPRILKGEVALFGTWAFRDITDELKRHMFAGSDPGLVESLIWAVYGSWCGAPARAADEANYLRLHTDLLSGRLQPAMISSTDRWPLTHLLTTRTEFVLRILMANDRLAEAAGLALTAQEGRTPVAQPGIAVERSADGSWRITPSVDFDSGSLQKKFTPWRVPAPR